jgi:hypothetical protein
MKVNKICESGLIGTDGRIRLPMDRVNEWSAQHKGERIIVRFEAAPQGTSELQLAYYFNYIVPTIQTALYKTGERKNEKQVDQWIRKQAAFVFEKVVPGTIVPVETCVYDDGTITRRRNVETIGYTETRGIRDLSVAEMSDFLEWLKQFASENLDVYIEDPKTL